MLDMVNAAWVNCVTNEFNWPGSGHLEGMTLIKMVYMYIGAILPCCGTCRIWEKELIYLGQHSEIQLS